MEKKIGRTSDGTLGIPITFSKCPIDFGWAGQNV